MGELLRKIIPIKLGDEELMVELNEGGDNQRGKIIHIQNDSFRFEMYEKEFLCLSAAVLRAKNEFDFIKERETDKKYAVIKTNKDKEIVTPKVNDPLIKSLTESCIPYRVINYKSKLITLIVNMPKEKRIVKLCHGIKKRIHPYCVEFGYNYLYKLTPFELYEKNEMFYQVFYQLPCASLTNKTFIPFDRLIQTKMWESYDEIDGVFFLSSHLRYIYRLCDCIFRKRAFTELDVEMLNEDEYVLNDTIMQELMSKVFFGFTSQMMCILKNKEYEILISRYLSYTL